MFSKKSILNKNINDNNDGDLREEPMIGSTVEE